MAEAKRDQNRENKRDESTVQHQAKKQEGLKYLEQKQYSQCVPLLTAVVKADPADAVAWAGLGAAHLGLGKHQQAVDDLTRSIELQPTVAKVWSDRGAARTQLHDTEGAIEDLDEAIKLDDKKALHFCRRAQAHKEQNNDDTAIDDLTAAIELEPNDADLRNLRSQCRQAIGALSAAFEDANDGVRLRPTDIEMWQQRMLVRIEEGSQLDSAVNDFSHMLALHDEKTDSRPPEWLTTGLLKPFPAAADLDAMMKNGVLHDALGFTLMCSSGLFKHAVYLFNRAVELDPNNALFYRDRTSALLFLQHNLEQDNQDYTESELSLIAQLHRNQNDEAVFKHGLLQESKTLNKNMDDVLGKGGFKHVRLCKLTEPTGILVAVSELQDAPLPAEQPGREAQFKREFAMLRTLRHPNIMNVFGECDFKDESGKGKTSFASEYHVAGNLFERLFRRGLFPSLRQRLLWARDLSRALFYISQRKPSVIHRDIKSGNVVISSDNRAVLIDFGLAVETNEDGLAEWQPVGTLRWMSPEALGVEVHVISIDSENDNDATGIAPSSDMWSLGCTLIELFAGVLPWHGESQKAAIKAENIKPDSGDTSAKPGQTAKAKKRGKKRGTKTEQKQQEDRKLEITRALRKAIAQNLERGQVPPELDLIEDIELRAFVAEFLRERTKRSTARRAIDWLSRRLESSDVSQSEAFSVADLRPRRLRGDKISGSVALRQLVNLWLSAIGFVATDSDFELPANSSLHHIIETVQAARHAIASTLDPSSAVVDLSSTPVSIRLTLRRLLKRLECTTPPGDHPLANHYLLPMSVSPTDQRKLFVHAATEVAKLVRELQTAEQRLDRLVWSATPASDESKSAEPSDFNSLSGQRGTPPMMVSGSSERSLALVTSHWDQ